jgi:hypothetical protein
VADNRGSGDWPEIPTVEAGRGISIHQEDVLCLDTPTAPPDWQWPPQSVVLTGAANDLAIDTEDETGAANDLFRKSSDMFHERHADGQITTLRQEVGQRSRRCDDDQVADR